MDLSITHMRPSFLDHSLSVHVSVWRSGCSHERQVAHRVQLWRDRHAGAPINLFSPSAAIIWRRQRCAARAKQEILCLYMLPDYPCSIPRKWMSHTGDTWYDIPHNRVVCGVLVSGRRAAITDLIRR